MRKMSCFISYSDDSAEHVEAVKTLADQLKAANITVKFYKFSDFCDVCKDIESFMEEAVIYSDKILMICTPEYAKKANRSGYVKMIITDDLLQNCGYYNIRKIIPVRFSGEKLESLPDFMLKKKSKEKVPKKVIDYLAEDSFNKIIKKIKPIRKSWTLDEFVIKHKVKRKKSIRDDLRKGFIKRDEIIEMLKIFSERYQHWHTHYWKLVIKSFVVLLSLMALPVILPKNFEIINVDILRFFPFLAMLLTIVLYLVLTAEKSQLHNIELKIKILIEVLSNNFTDFDPNIFNFRFSGLLSRYQMANWVLYLFFFLGCSAGVESIFIWRGWL